jgi:RNase H-like domain found in reverse transcriptase
LKSKIFRHPVVYILVGRLMDRLLIGHKFELVTDHQPLLAIFNPNKGIPVAAANRLQRWAIYLMGYTYVIRYKSTYTHANADALSRLPAGPDESFVDDDAWQIAHIQSEIIKDWPMDAEEIRCTTDKDKLLSIIIQYTRTKWPTSLSQLTKSELIPYFNQ